MVSLNEQNLREQVVQQVRAAIVSGQSGPGTMYSVPGLAASLGVSTTPVREALLELARGGLIEPIRNRGFKVVEPTVDDLRNLFELRELLEVFAVETLARKPDRDLDGLRALAGAVAEAVEQDDVGAYLASDRKFHQALTEAAGNPQLTELVMTLRDRMRLYGISSRAGLERQRASVDEHYRIIELAQAGDAKALRPLMREHIRSWEPIFVAALERLGRRPPGVVPLAG
jgi:DNA-binding GntR family transcriptional regulator